MNSKRKTLFDVIVEAQRRGDANDRWNHRTVSVLSLWGRGSEQEKFEVLRAIRQVYKPDEHADIRGSAGQTPHQIGQSEGFTHLQYRRTAPPLGITVIVAD